MPGPLADRIAAVAALAEPTRRRLYDYVVRARTPVGRDEAAQALGIHRATAAFHLDRLVEEHLLEVVHERLTGRSGPGAGRPAKLYFRSDEAVSVSLPGRRYDLAGHLLADAFAALDDSAGPPGQVLARQAHSQGLTLAREAAEETDADVVDVLEAADYEPRVVDDRVVLENCPFHALAVEHTDLVCTMNLHFVSGLVEGCRDSREAQLRPHVGRCCIELR